MTLSVITNGVWVRFGTDSKDSRNMDYDSEKQGRFLIINGNEEDWKSLGMVLKLQKSKMKTLILTYSLDENLEEMSEFLDKFKKLLTALSSPLRTEELQMVATDQSEILQILPHLDSTSLKSIVIRHPEISQFELKIDEIKKLPHFKNARNVEIDSHNHCFRPHQFLYLPRFSLRMKSMSVYELIYVLEKIMNTSIFQSLSLRYSDFNDEHRLTELWGPPEYSYRPIGSFFFNAREIDRYWYFKFPNLVILQVCIYHSNKLDVRRLTGEEAKPKMGKAKDWQDWIGLRDDEVIVID